MVLGCIRLFYKTYRGDFSQTHQFSAILDFGGHFEFWPHDMKNDNIVEFLDLKNPYLHQKIADMCQFGPEI